MGEAKVFVNRPLEGIKAIRGTLAAKGLEAGYLVATQECVSKVMVDVRGQLHDYLWKQGVLEFLASGSGRDAGGPLPAWYVGVDSMEEAPALLCPPGASDDVPRLRLPSLPDFAEVGDPIAILAHRRELYLVNLNEPAVLESARDPSSPFGRLLEELSDAGKKPIMDMFSAWNLRLLKSFFSEASEGEEVFLRVDKEVLDEIGQDLGGDAGFIAAVRAGPNWLRPSDSLVEKVLALQRQRRSAATLAPSDGPRRMAANARTDGYIDPGEVDASYRAHAAPAYLPYLAMFVRVAAVATQEGFYNNLRGTLGLREQFGSNQLAMVEAVWADLEHWTSSRLGKFGIFKLRRLGGYVHIGVPLSQSILKPADVQRVPLLFKRAEVRPDREFDDNAVAKVLGEARNEAVAGNFFSASFQAALGRPSFEAPICSILRAIYEDWDGALPDRRSQQMAEGGGTRIAPSVGLCLSLVRDDPLEFDLHWSLPAIHDSGSFELHHGLAIWDGTYAGADGGLARAVDGLQEHAWRLAEEAFNGDVEFRLASQLGDETEEVIEQVTLTKHWLWIMVPATEGPLRRPCLREGELPGYGTSFLLVPPGNVERLESYLDRLQPDHDVIEASGIPEGWMLVRLNECSTLTDDQRTLPDGAEVHRTPRLIRFVGGRSVRRGYGHMYLPYDLPDVEFDAPAEAEIKFPDGLSVVVEEPTPTDSSFSSKMLGSIRRYKLRLQKSGSASYKFEALQDGEVIGRPAILRISGTDGDLVDAGQDFSLDPLGGPLASREGLSGLLPDWMVPEQELEGFAAVNARDLGTPVGARGLDLGVEEKFLDALAQPGAGAMDTGVARKLLGRLLADAGRNDNPTFVLMELRSRGHIEIATTQKGQLARVHVVRPTIFRLPMSVEGNAAYGVLGSLRLAHWELLASANQGLQVISSRCGRQRFRSLRLIEESPGAMLFACSAQGRFGQAGFQLASFPSQAIASWCDDLEVIRESAFQNPMESIGRAAEEAMRFNAARGLFSARPSRLPIELWKTRDLDTGLGQVHYLVENDQQSSQLLHSFVRDSRWGVWIALEAFARYMKEEYGRDDVHPFPLIYQESSRTIWLPARLGLPVALERALVLCAGGSSEVWELQGARAASNDELLALHYAEEEEPRVRISRVYEQMADAKWLAYRWIPRAVATVLARKLGARLDSV